MITIVGVLVFLFLAISVIVSNKSSFKLIFSFLTTIGIYVFLSNINYNYEDIFLAFSSLLHFLIIIYVKFSQTGKVRVVPTPRNRYSNNIAPIVSLVLSSLLILVILESISDDMLIENLTPVSRITQNFLLDGNIAFVIVSSLLMIIIHISRKVGEK